jgi:lipoprotein NlpD
MPRGEIFPAPCIWANSEFLEAPMRLIRFCTLLLIASILAGCASRGQRAPVFDRAEAEKKNAATAKGGAREKDWRPEVYVVQKGDTLYSIAFNYGFDYHELAELNRIGDPSLISIGQEIRLFPGRSGSGYPPAMVEAKPIESLLKEQPKVVKYAYSEAAMAQIEKVQEQKFRPAMVAKVESKPDTRTETAIDDGADDADEAGLGWSIPAQGKLIGGFSESANRKGIDIAGTLGQPVFASAPGKVVYSGSGLRGYGKLIIIKHNKTYLSAYAHNDKILVKEGQSVTRGQKIAAMGNTDTDQVKLHFEVRRFGKPVDPAKYLPLGKS